MDLINLLHEEEKNKNYRKFCDIAEDILASEKLVGPSILFRHIQERKNFYQKKFLNQLSNPIEVCRIIEKLDKDSLFVLNKCCPNLSDISYSQICEDRGISSCQLADSQNNISDILITKKKELKISWNAGYRASKTNIFYFQVLLESEFRMSRLRQKVSSQICEDWRVDLLELDNEFMPIFIVHFNPFLDSIDCVNLIPFPSALRGSYHYAELVNHCSESSGISAIDEFIKYFTNTSEEEKIEQISLNPGNYDVGLVYSNEDFRRWINLVHNISIVKRGLSSSKNILHLPPNSYPTISSIVNGFARASESISLDASNILIVDDSDYTPLYRLSAKLPVSGNQKKVADELTLPSITNQGTPINTESLLSILKSNNSYLTLHPYLNPRSNFPEKSLSNKINNPGIFVVIKVSEVADLSEEAFLSLVHQNDINISHIILHTCNACDQNKLKEKISSMSLKWKWPIKILINADILDLRRLMEKISKVLFINQYIILRDPNTLSVLADTLTKYQSFSSGCMLNHMHSSKKQQLISNNTAGLHLSFNSYSDTGRISLQAKNIVSTIPPSDICVLSNHHDLSLYNCKLLLSTKLDQSHLNNLDLYLAQSSCEASLKGLHNVCTTKVSANYFKSPTVNTTLTLDSKTSKHIVDNLSSLTNQITLLHNLLP